MIEKKRQAALRRKQILDDHAAQSVAAYKAKQRVQINNIIKNHKEREEQLLQRINDMDRQMQLIENEYQLQIAKLEQQLDSYRYKVEGTKNGNKSYVPIEVELSSPEQVIELKVTYAKRKK